MKTICIFSLLEWEEELLHRTHALAEKFAAMGIKVIYFERKKLSKKTGLKIFTISERKMNDKLTVISVPKIPYWNGRVPFSDRINDQLIANTLNQLIYREDIKGATFFIESPMWIKGIHQSKLKDHPLFYDVSDDYGAFSKTEGEKKLWMNYEETAAKLASTIFTTTESLKELLIKRYQPKCELITVENGVDLDAFNKVIFQGKIDVHEKKVKQIGFIGGIFEWVDLDLIEKILLKFTNIEFKLIGPTNQLQRIKELEKYPHFTYLGVIHHSEIPKFYQSLDIGVIPFVSEEQYPRLRTVNSNKVYQYLYCGYPVVSTYYKQMEEFQGSQLIYIAKDHDAFIQNIEKALQEHSKELREKRKGFASEQSWERKARKILSKMEEKEYEDPR